MHAYWPKQQELSEDAALDYTPLISLNINIFIQHAYWQKQTNVSVSLEWYTSFYATCSYVNSFSAKGNIDVSANKTDSGESARNELSHLKSALFAF